MTYKDSAGQPAGFAVAVLNEAARRERIPLNWHPAGTSREIEQALSAGQLDLVPAGMITPERQRQFFVSPPWWYLETSILGRAGAGVHTEADLAGKRFGLSSPIYRYLAQKRYPSADVVPYENAIAAAEALCSGDVDAILIDHGELHDLIRGRRTACRDVQLESFDSDIVLELALVGRPQFAGEIGRLREQIDAMALDGTLSRLATHYPQLSATGAIRLAAELRMRYQSRLWRGLFLSAIVVLVAVAFFIFRQHRTTRSLRHERELLQRVIDTIPVMITFGDPRTGECTVNRAFENTLGYRAVTCHDLPWLDPAANGKDWRDIELTAQDGSRVATSWAQTSLSDGTRIGIGIDLRERQRVEKLLHDAQRMESLGWLAGGLAHDFNNILTIIGGNIGLVADTPDTTPDARASLETALDACGRAAALTRQMLAYAGKGECARRPVQVTEVARQAVRDLRASVDSRIQLRTELDPGLPEIVSDPNQLHQVLTGIILNGVEAISGAGIVTVRTGFRGGDVALEVEDTGCGMDEETRRRMFEPFFSTKFTGRGLGLAAVHGLVRSLGGQIEVQSAPGAGTRVCVSIPADHPMPDVVKLEIRPEPVEPAVLIVDDEAAIRRMSAAILEKHGIRVFEAGTGQQAIEQFRTDGGAIRVMILDLSLPDLNGDQALAVIAQSRPDLHVIVSSGHAESEIRRHFTAAQIRGLLPKPFTATQLLSLVVPALGPPTRAGK